MSWHFERFHSLLQGCTWQNHFHCSSQWGIQWHHLLFMAIMQKIKATEIIWGPVVKRLSTPKGHFREKRAICNPGLKRNAHVMQVTASVCFLFPATFCRLRTASPEIRPVFVIWSVSFDVHGKLWSPGPAEEPQDQLWSPGPDMTLVHNVPRHTKHPSSKSDWDMLNIVAQAYIQIKKRMRTAVCLHCLSHWREYFSTFHIQGTGKIQLRTTLFTFPLCPFHEVNARPCLSHTVWRAFFRSSKNQAWCPSKSRKLPC